MFEEDNIESPKTQNEYMIEYASRLYDIDMEIDELKQAKKDLKAEYADRIDMQAAQQVLRTINILKKVDARQTYDGFLNALEKKMGLAE